MTLRPTSRRERLTLWAIGGAVAALVGVLLGTALMIERYVRAERNAILAESAAIAQAVAALIEAHEGSHFKILHAYAPRFLFRDAVARRDRTEIDRHLRQLQESFPEMDRVFVIAPDGVLVANHPPAPQLYGRRFTDRDWYQALGRDPRPYTSRVYHSARDGALHVVHVVPVRSETGRVVGILGSSRRLETIRSGLTSITVPGGDFYLVDREGQLVFHRTRTGAAHLADYAKTPVVERLLRGEAGIAETDNPVEREARLSVYQRLPSLGWGLVVYRSRDLALQPARRITLGAGAAGLVLAGAIAGLGTVALRSRRRTVDALRALEAAQEELVRKERLAILGQLAGGVAHELRNPLGVIKNSVYYLRMVAPQDERVQKHLGLLEREVATANRIVTDLLDFARVRPPERVPTDLEALAAEVLERAALPEGITVVFERRGGGPRVEVDPDQVMQVLANLVTNAAQAMPEGGTLTIEIAASGGGARVAVADTGVGIPPENLERIFQPLFTTRAKGIGLGLAVARSLAEANGGALTAESAPGRGSRFVLEFRR